MMIQERGGPLRKPSPSFAYELVNKKPCPRDRRGRYPGQAEEKKWNGIHVDKSLEDKWLNQLNSIQNVEIRGTCSGHGPEGGDSLEWVTYVAFRIDPSLEKKPIINKILKKLNSFKNTVAGSDIGMEGRPRFVVAAPLYYKCKRHNDWVNWWKNISAHISVAVNDSLPGGNR